MNYIVKGGEFNNKGAEAMSLIAIYHIKKADPQSKIYFFDCGYNFIYGNDLDIIPFTLYNSQLEVLKELNSNKYRYFLLKNFIKKFVKRKTHLTMEEINYKNNIFMEADYLIDISGYALSSKWGEKFYDYLNWIDTIKCVNPKCKVYLMPQSFGPFDFPNQKETEKLLYTVLSKCEKIFAREDEGYIFFKKIGLNNVVKSLDSVLIENRYSASDVICNFEKYNKVPEISSERKIAIIPNYRLKDMANFNIDDLLRIYKDCIDLLIPAHEIYLIPHAGEDFTICKRIKKLYLDDRKVILIDHVLKSFEYEELIKNFDYIIASRYHSIIHSYRQGIPAIILGWSEKYNDIASVFSQSFYVYDFNDTNDLMKIIRVMNENYKVEKKQILEILEKIQKNNCYDFLYIKR